MRSATSWIESQVNLTFRSDGCFDYKLTLSPFLVWAIYTNAFRMSCEVADKLVVV